jgi:hypothetical protein
MSSRDLVLGSIRRSLGVNGREAPRKAAIEIASRAIRAG